MGRATTLSRPTPLASGSQRRGFAQTPASVCPAPRPGVAASGGTALAPETGWVLMSVVKESDEETAT